MQIQRCFGILSEVVYTYILASQQMPLPPVKILPYFENFEFFFKSLKFLKVSYYIYNAITYKNIERKIIQRKIIL